MDGYPHEGGAWLELGRPGFDDLDRRQQIRWLVAVGWNGYTLVDPGRIAVLEQALALGGQERWGSVMWAYLLWALLQSFHEATAAAGAFRDPTGFALSRHYGALIRQHLSDGERRACRREAWSLTLQEAVSFGLAAG